MGVAFELEVTRSRSELCWRLAIGALPAVGFGLAAWRLTSGPTILYEGSPAGLAPAVLAAGGLLAVLFGRMWGRRRTKAGATRLVVDDAGDVSLRLDGASAVPFSLASTCALPGLTLLVMAPYPMRPSRRAWGGTVTLVIGRSGAAADDWRRLQVWLRWMERGRSGRPEAGSDQT